MPEDAVLLIIDVQEGFKNPVWGARNNPDAEANVARLLEEWRERGWPVVHVQHASVTPGRPLHPDSPGFAFQAAVSPRDGEPIMRKSVNSAFIGTGLEAWLRERDHRTLVIAGLTTPHCVSTTTRMAGNLGFETFLVSDATAAFELRGPDGRTVPPEMVHQVELAALHGEFATVVETADLLAREEGPSGVLRS
jgi:nicotinamidase-related amidase